MTRRQLMVRYELFSKKRPAKPSLPREGSDDPERARPKPTPVDLNTNPRAGLVVLF